ncbi:hypothetical protein A2331_02000 [Candidatus Falkowbacteria bacterium RIFOXYB2_FULL_34_18]|uniref:Uncharacterized protein n=1 Tax=Candidatus Falkowbacteria bacterium RIFOXYD2_FULL_34_120 TaxID=1798007 RepID=A0A1F5TQB7_9BACT|nr:MAG: hypothetical protein A2331_02000 [Candidatus Falkowbacteria bacterium RIFOXYB2_FULL_34_18]OGF29453.1 MAG: hypothetical protein A2500_01060 [Candidatus Falkowbacteria bacterium RIFOXYC12_FULL_34_55]OGF36766.1 MAG: hypothetical protein A2466_03370 [Candidatus Falkowbacteria bacterium RIFOXYC2_FULL_34_220]OGF38979.1 MAG: hypothetical protein A2515_05485 [Candidatus Falkowbacteria bacterium RIFOXYD12_FULL_34_57]OGF41172.1 MAG: hypothetical protein A2531_01490 [Candidatus Falkowbacteria bact
MFYKYFKLSLFVFFINILFFTNFCNAQLKDYSGMGGQANKTAETAGFDSGVGGGDAIGGIIASLIKAFLSILGIIFLILVIYGGYKWMMARGSEQEVEAAKNIIQRAIIGLIIIVAAYAITAFVFTGLEDAVQ